MHFFQNYLHIHIPFSEVSEKSAQEGDNLVLIKQVKDICARYWYMVQSITNHWTTRYLQVQKVRPPEPFLTEHAINNGIFREFANRNIAQPIFGKG